MIAGPACILYFAFVMWLVLRDEDCGDEGAGVD